jgi:hypothetical protein
MASEIVANVAAGAALVVLVLYLADTYFHLGIFDKLSRL